MNPDSTEHSLINQRTYRITIPGHLDKDRADWGWDLAMEHHRLPDGTAVTDIIMQADQAALQGLLRRLYAVGLPLISVERI